MCILYVHTVHFVENCPVYGRWPADQMVIDQSYDQQSFLKVGLQYQLAIFCAFQWPTELIPPVVDSSDRNLHSFFEYTIFSLQH